MDTEDLESLVTGFTAAKPPFPVQNEFEKGKTQALHIIGQLISKELRPLKENISKLETDVSFLVNRMAECYVITAEFPGLCEDINGCLEVTTQLQISAAEQGEKWAS